ncbi:hypothetical protein ME0900_18550 [Lactobacillus delbrueckii subsp. bulgaricus]|uniref:Uncharacterized protein n=1 Tax=Lactobacillus delbrueckii subsp. bulgaricus TaxID=1585 RepID=A0AAV5PSL4_LACDE|nr:hypothetical protein ME0900_18550 [Lactobacillus delbrueckii subsp. bulgaricus]
MLSAFGVKELFGFDFFFFFQAEDGIRDRSPSRGLGIWRRGRWFPRD